MKRTDEIRKPIKTNIRELITVMSKFNTKDKTVDKIKKNGKSKYSLSEF